MTDFFISDTHFGHENIMKFCGRPFQTPADMDAEMIRRWNAKVTNDDTVYHLGDFCFGRGVETDYKRKVFGSLNGRKVLIKGNHDHSDVRSLPWGAIHDSLIYKTVTNTVHLYHFPIWDWDRKFHGSLHFYGHVHNNVPTYNPAKNAFNISVEVRNFEPMTVEEIVAGGEFGVDTRV